MVSHIYTGIDKDTPLFGALYFTNLTLIYVCRGSPPQKNVIWVQCGQYNNLWKKTIYTLPFAICTRIFCVVFRRYPLRESMRPMSSIFFRSFHWHSSNHMTMPVPVKHTWGSWHGWVITSIINCGMELLAHCQTATVQPLNFGNW